ARASSRDGRVPYQPDVPEGVLIPCDWSVRDILAHVATREEEALTHLPLILEGGRPRNRCLQRPDDRGEGESVARRRATAAGRDPLPAPRLRPEGARSPKIS